MKKNYAICNIVTNMIVQLVVALSGFILPKYILNAYGTAVNGMINSVSQFLTYAALVEMGVGNAAVVALYKPLADGDIPACNVVLTTARQKYMYTGILYTILTFVLSFLYPIMIRGQLAFSFVFSITLIMSISGMIDYFIIGKYKVLLIADQRYYVINVIKAAVTGITTVGSVILLLQSCSLQIVKGFALVTHLLEAMAIWYYVHRFYAYADFQGKETVVLDQQKPALVGQICATIVYNTDLVVLTLFLSNDSLKEIGVYTVYSMALALVKNLVSVLTTGINASFGSLFARGKQQEVRETFKLYEFLYFLILFITYSLFVSLIIPFVSCYTEGITDVNYIRYPVGILFGAVGLLSQLKDASGVVVNGAGRYKQTQKYAVAEAGVNIVISLLLVRPFGIVGVLFGTLVSHMVMDAGIIGYAANELLPGSTIKTVRRIIRNLGIMSILCVISGLLHTTVTSWMEWLCMAVGHGLIYSIVIVGINFLCESECAKDVVRKFGVKRK